MTITDPKKLDVDRVVPRRGVGLRSLQWTPPGARPTPTTSGPSAAWSRSRPRPTAPRPTRTRAAAAAVDRRPPHVRRQLDGPKLRWSLSADQGEVRALRDLADGCGQ
ncbi:hypothetical protein NKH77_50365 [Streptomyces sp. M19]